LAEGLFDALAERRRKFAEQGLPLGEVVRAQVGEQVERGRPEVFVVDRDPQEAAEPRLGECDSGPCANVAPRSPAVPYFRQGCRSA
jgi:hypothetical protein